MRFLAIMAIVLGFCTSAYGASCTTSFTTENNTTAPVSVGQSWTSTCTGNMTFLTVKADTPNAGLMTLKIYNGQSLAAPDLLRTQAGNPALVHGENSIILAAPLSLVAGQQYTFLLTNESANGIKLRYDVGNGYVGGQATAGAGFVAGSDIWFKINVDYPVSVPMLSEWGVILFSLLILAVVMHRLKKAV